MAAKPSSSKRTRSKSKPTKAKRASKRRSATKRQPLKAPIEESTDVDAISDNNSEDDEPAFTVLPQRKAGRVPYLFRVLGTRFKLMLTYIEAGAYDYVAAQSIGIDHQTFGRWMRRGANPKDLAAFKTFRTEVLKANSKARMRCEIAVAQDSPTFWLSTGPARTRKYTDRAGNVIEMEGWTKDHAPLRIEHTGDINQHVDGQVNVDAEMKVEIEARIFEEKTNALGDALQILGDLGFIKPGDNGTKLLKNGAPIDVESKPSTNGHSK